MKKFSQQFHKQASKTVKLRQAETNDLRERLVSYMEYHPLPVELQKKVVSKNKAPRQPVITEAFVAVTVPFRALFKSSLIAGALLLVAVPFFAERAVPGDTLYAVKVQFNEELRGTLTFDSYKKVEWETTRLNRRIAEARLLASEGLLTDEVEAEVAAAVKVHTENAKREIAELRTEDVDGAAIASITLDATLAVQATALRSEENIDAEGVATTTPQVSLIAVAIDESRDQSVEDEQVPTVLPAYEKMMAQVEQNTTRIYELKNTLQPTLVAEDFADVERRMADIERSIEEVIALVSTDAPQAQQDLVKVLQSTQRLIVYITELEVIETVDIEEILPVIMTAEEKVEQVAVVTAELSRKALRIEELLLTTADEAVQEKAVFAQGVISTLAKKMTTANESFLAFTAYATEALALADDTIGLLEQAKVIVVPELTESIVATTSTSTIEVVVDDEENLNEETGEVSTSTEAIVLKETAGSTEEDETEEDSAAENAAE